MPFKIIFFFGAVDSNSKSRSELERSEEINGGRTGRESSVRIRSECGEYDGHTDNDG